MYFVATRRQPFAERAHDQYLALSICNGIRPEITEKEAPGSFQQSYLANNECKKQFEKTDEYRRANIIFNQTTTHPQAIYTFNPYTTGLNDKIDWSDKNDQ